MLQIDFLINIYSDILLGASRGLYILNETKQSLSRNTSTSHILLDESNIGVTFAFKELFPIMKQR